MPDGDKWSERLLEAALSRGDSPLGLTEKEGRMQDLLGSGELERLCEMSAMADPQRGKPRAYMIEYNDGFRTTMLTFEGGDRGRLLRGPVDGRIRILRISIRGIVPIPAPTLRSEVGVQERLNPYLRYVEECAMSSTGR